MLQLGVRTELPEEPRPFPAWRMVCTERGFWCYGGFCKPKGQSGQYGPRQGPGTSILITGSFAKPITFTSQALEIRTMGQEIIS